MYKVMHKCPRCQERSLKEIKPNIYRCVSCRERVDVNELDWGWFIAAIAFVVGIAAIAQSPSSANLSTAQPIVQPTVQPTAQLSSTQLNSEYQPIAIAKAISGRQVMVEINGKPKVVLLCGLNAPTPNSQHFTVATAHLQQLLDRTGVSNLTLTAIAEVRGTPIVELYDRRDRISLNARQVASGYAVSSQVLVGQCADHDRILASAEQAKTEQRGLWAQ